MMAPLTPAEATSWPVRKEAGDVGVGAEVTQGEPLRGVGERHEVAPLPAEEVVEAERRRQLGVVDAALHPRPAVVSEQRVVEQRRDLDASGGDVGRVVIPLPQHHADGAEGEFPQ
jgi:hypothetical protein